jgi:FkbM family methyltransferase
MIENIKLLYRAYQYRRQDGDEIAYLERCIKKDDTVFDIGAHKGGYTFWMQKAVGYHGKVIAFEPQQKGAQLLRNIFPARNVHVVSAALSNSKGKQSFYIQPQAASVSYEASLENKYDTSSVDTVETTTIDTYCIENDLHPAFLKIDVEGHEQQVIEGGVETLTRLHPVLLIEAEVRHIGEEKINQLFRLIEGLGYEGFFYWKGKRLSLKDFDPAIHQSLTNLHSNQKLYCNNFMFEPAS